MDENNKLIVFEDKNIKRVWHDEEWYFSVVDVIDALETSSIPKRYWSDLKSRLFDEGFEPYEKIVQLKLKALDGKLRETDCANTENMFRIIQSIPSKKAEPFKQWLAQVGYERIEEIENPELAQDRAKEYYKNAEETLRIANLIKDSGSNMWLATQKSYAEYLLSYSLLMKL